MLVRLVMSVRWVRLVRPVRLVRLVKLVRLVMLVRPVRLVRRTRSGSANLDTGLGQYKAVEDSLSQYQPPASKGWQINNL